MGFARLPNEILLDIGHVCTVQRLSSLHAVNHYFHNLLSDIFYKFAIPASKDLGILSDNPAGRAIVNDWTLVLKRLLERGLDANTVVGPEERRKSLLHIAVVHAIKPAVELLLEFGANPEAPDGIEMSTPLMLAYNHGNMEMLRLLLEKGANANALSKYSTPLYSAVQNGNRPAVEVLLGFRADIDALDESGISPLMLACARWPFHKEIIVILLENGADIEVGDWPGWAAHHNYGENGGIKWMLRDMERGDIHPCWGVLIEGIRRMLRDAVEEDILGDETGEMNEEDA
jgi:hypothetical protein